MDPTRFRWISCENTHILMRKTETGCLDEWMPVAQVTLRQMYSNILPAYYVWLSAEPHDELLGRFGDLGEARARAETAAGA